MLGGGTRHRLFLSQAGLGVVGPRHAGDLQGIAGGRHLGGVHRLQAGDVVQDAAKFVTVPVQIPSRHLQARQRRDVPDLVRLQGSASLSQPSPPETIS